MPTHSPGIPNIASSIVVIVAWWNRADEVSAVKNLLLTNSRFHEKKEKHGSLADGIQPRGRMHKRVKNRPVLQRFAANIKRIRLERGLSQHDVALEAGVDPSQYGR